jgi:hypothetical protein
MTATYRRFLNRARRQAFNNRHLLNRFRQGTDADGKADPFTYATECQFCKSIVLVWRDDEKGEWLMSGPPLNHQCKKV